MKKKVVWLLVSCLMVAASQNIALGFEDHKEGVTAIREKRRAKFQGK